MSAMDLRERRFATLRALLSGLPGPDRRRWARRLQPWWPPREPHEWDRRMAAFEQQLADDLATAAERLRSLPPVRYPDDLPVAQRRAEIVEALRLHPVVVLAGETGSGKSTQIPKMLLEAGCGARGRIAVTQPRRVAAFSVSQRIADELGVKLGDEVGCKIRFADRTTARTAIKVVTDGVLLAEIQGDPDLWEYDAIMVDEAHERSLNIDFLIGYLRRLRARRPDLRIVVTSATLDTARFAAAFDGAPVLQVEGRAHPVEIIHRAPEAEAEGEAEGHLAVAVRLVEEICASGRPGDILVFLPGERDIREGIDLLGGKARGRGGKAGAGLGRIELLPLYARLTQAEQQRIFAGGQARKVILATNVAETSLTIPGVRFVIDSGLARISRYRAHTRTLALPIEPISQASAKQRAGRAGRTAPGICYRIYDEADWASRAEETPPEIARANLAGVILQMESLGLGHVEDFPFLEPPPPRAVEGGYALLRELGALEPGGGLTEVGRRLARLPIDPTLGRMLLQAEDEGSLREVLVIAAALSVADPRERPADERAAADAAHRQWAHPESDFLALWNLWQAAFEDPARPGGRGLARFARENHLSFVRLREWRDLREQLEEALAEAGELRLRPEAAEYAQVHRALLAGSLGHVARRAEGGNYRAVRNRTAWIFPGSVLAKRREERPKRGPDAPRKPQPRPAGPEWILAAEWMETERLYARTVARIDAAWLLDLGAHLLRVAHTEPGWDEKGGRVRCRERRWLHGLLVDERWVSYRPIDPEAATDLFVRAGLVAGTIRERVPILERNAEVVRRVEALHARRRGGSALEREERLYRFYRDRLEAVGSVGDLRAWLREHGEERLQLTEAALLGRVGPDELEAYPEHAVRAGRRYELRYAYAPGAEEDGVTIMVPWRDVAGLPEGWLDWLVPGHLEERVELRLRGLPKELRVQLFPLAERQAAWLAQLQPGDESLTAQLARLIEADTGAVVRPADWARQAEPDWLRVRVAAVDADGRVLAAGRDLAAVRAAVEAEIARHRSAAPEVAGAAWQAAAARWEQAGLVDWPPTDPPERVPVGRVGGVDVEAFPGMAAARADEDGVAAVRLFPQADDAARASRAGVRALWRQVLRYDLAWLRKDIGKGLKELAPLYVTFGTIAHLEPDAWYCAEQALFGGEPCWPLQRRDWEARLDRSRRELRGLAPEFLGLAGEILRRRQALEVAPVMRPFQAELARIVSPRFLKATPLPWLRRVPVWLEALARRAAKAARQPPQDAARAAQITPWADLTTQSLQSAIKANHVPRWQAWKEFSFLVEEYRVQVFAQELGTSVPVSPKRLEEERRRLG